MSLNTQPDADKRRVASETEEEDDDDEIPQLIDASDAAANTLNSTPSTTANDNIKPATQNSSTGSSTAANASISAENGQAQPPVPLTILTGWLGSGKTTLLTRLLSHFSSVGQKIAIIQNEASAMGVEEELKVNKNEDDDNNTNSSTSALRDILELSNGCVCCSVKNDFISGIEELLRRRRFDYILLECSGLADPGPLAQMFWVDPELESGVYLDGIITVVDAFNLLGHLGIVADDENGNGQVGSSARHSRRSSPDERRQVIHQIAYADRIILNKIDLVPDGEQLSRCEQQIRQINSAKISRAVKSDVPVEEILFIKAFDVHDTTRALLPASTAANPPPCDAGCNESHDHHQHHHHHDHSPSPSPSLSPSPIASHPHDTSITTFMIDDIDLPPLQRRCVDLHRLKLWLADLLWQDILEEEGLEYAQSARPPKHATESTSMRPNEIFRLKAIMHVKGESKPMFLQGVQELYDIQPGNEWPQLNNKDKSNKDESTGSAAQPFTRFVFIGRRLDHEILREGFQSIFDPSSPQ